MPSIILLDSGPLSNCVVTETQTEPLTTAQACRRWLTDCERNGATLIVPTIAYYEVLREIERRNATAQLQRLRQFCFQPDRFLFLTTALLEAAAQLWARARNTGSPTGHDDALDGDSILCAQALSLGLPVEDYIIASTNPKHLRSFVPVDEWQNIVM